jgi:hypothetical protein
MFARLFKPVERLNLLMSGLLSALVFSWRQVAGMVPTYAHQIFFQIVCMNQERDENSNEERRPEFLEASFLEELLG